MTKPEQKDPDVLFVYGELREGDAIPWMREVCPEAYVAASLLTNGDYPTILETGMNLTRGSLWTPMEGMKDVAFEYLDVWRGQKIDLYQRKVIKTLPYYKSPQITTHYQIYAWAYVWNKSLQYFDEVPSGDWLEHLEGAA